MGEPSRCARLLGNPPGGAAPLSLLADPDQRTDGHVWTRPADAVAPWRIRTGARVWAGWGEQAWRARVLDITDATVTLTPPPGEPQQEAGPAAWAAPAEALLARTTSLTPEERTALARALLAQPTQDFHRLAQRALSAERALRLLRGAARRVVYRLAAAEALGEPVRTRRLPAFLILARAARVPESAARGNRPRHIWEATVQPRCPTARNLAVGRLQCAHVATEDPERGPPGTRRGAA